MKYNFGIKIINKELATEFVKTYHYSSTMPYITKYYLGYYIDEELKSIMTLGYGTKPRHTFNKIFPNSGILKKHNDSFILNINDIYFEIGKLCIATDLNNTTAGSQLLSATFKWLRKNTNTQFLYTIADGMMGKAGYLYQASNFYYSEKFKTYAFLVNDRNKVHPKTLKYFCEKDPEFRSKNNITKIYGYMFRYLYPLNKKAHKIMMTESSMIWSKNYPKEHDLR